MADTIVEACEQIHADPTIGAVIATGNGPFFCAGQDRAQLAAAGRDPAEPGRYRDLGRSYNAFARVGALAPPTVAAIRGGALGAGLNLALATDLRVVAADAKLLSGFLPIGLDPGAAVRRCAAAPPVGTPRTRCGASASPSPDCRRSNSGSPGPQCRPPRSRRPPSTSPACPPAIPSLRGALRDRCGRSPAHPPWPAALDLQGASQMWSSRRRDLAEAAS